MHPGKIAVVEQRAAPPAEWFRSCVERMADVVCAIDRDGTVVYANAATTTWLGLSAEELVGRNCLDIVHPDEHERAIATVAYGRGSDRSEVPVTFRLRSTDGWGSFDVRGHGLGTDPEGRTMLIVARESNGTDVLDELLDCLAGGGDVARSLELIAHQLRRPLWQNAVAIIYHDGDGERHVAQAGLDPRTAAVFATDAPSPWRRAMLRGEEVVANDLDGVDERAAALLRDAGFSSLLATPVTDPLTKVPVCLVVCGPAWLDTWDLGIAVAVERVKRLLRLTLQQRYHQTMLERSARTDPLTGLSNRREFFDVLESELDDLRSDAAPQVAVTYIDLDGFKQVNDVHGHGAGDHVLREVASRLRSVAERSATVARLGGDEFAIIVVDGDGDALAAEAIEAIAQPIRLHEGAVRVGASAGTARALPGDDARAVVDRADTLAYEAKRERIGGSDEQPGDPTPRTS